MTTLFQVNKVNRMRRKIENLRSPAGDSLSEDGWHKSDLDPTALLDVVDCLWMKEGFTLRAYLYRVGGNGNGIVWALPTDSPYPEPSECDKLTDQFLEPPKPKHALDDFMEAIDGDRSQWSYMCASILVRELWEFGARWHGCSWNDERIVSLKGRAQSVWTDSPCIVPHGQGKTCYFYSISEQSGSLIRNQFNFKTSLYDLSCIREEIGRAGSGFVY